MLAVRHGHLEAITVLIKAVADINFKDKFGQTALKLAIAGKYIEVEKRLREAGAKE